MSATNEKICLEAVVELVILYSLGTHQVENMKSNLLLLHN